MQSTIKLQDAAREKSRQTRLTLLYGGIFLLVVMVFVVFAFLMKARESAESENNALISSNISYSQRIANLQSDNDWLSAENERLNVQLSDLAAAISDLQAGNEANLDAIASLESLRDSLQAQIENLNAQIAELTARIAELEAASIEDGADS